MYVKNLNEPYYVQIYVISHAVHESRLV